MNPIVIVGGGVVGTSLAYFLHDADRDVVLLEKDTLAAGATGDSRSIFAWHLNTEGVYYDICERTWEIYRPLVDEGFLNFHKGGFLMLAQTEEYMAELEERVDEFRGTGVETEVVRPDDLEEYRIGPDADVPGGLYLDEGRFTGPAGRQICTYFADRAAERGVEVRERTSVTDVHVEGGRVTGVQTSAGSIEASAVVNAAGPWSPKLDEMAGADLPIKHTMAPMIEYELDEEFGPGEPLSLVTYEDGLYFVGEFPRLAWAGNAPHEGSEGDRFDGKETYDADVSFDSGLSNEFRRTVAERIERLHPPLETTTVTQEWKCMRTVTPDHYPLAGETTIEGFYAATGMNGQGITIGPGVAAHLADQIHTGETSPQLDALDPLRF